MFDESIKYSVIIPVYNESAVITSSLTQALDYMRSLNDEFEIIVVDDGSTDNTVALVEDYARYHSEVKIIKNPHKGKANSVRTGMLAAVGEYKLAADADMATPMPEFKRLLLWITEHDYDIAIASREGVGARRHGEPYYRHVVGRVFNYFIKLFALRGIQDTQCGFKLFKGHVSDRIFSRLQIYGENLPVIKKPFFGAFEVEVLYLARKYGYSIKEVPVAWTYVPTPRFNFFGNSWKMARDVIKIRLYDLMGKYDYDK